MTPGYVVFNQVKVEGLNAEPNQYIIGFPSITAFTGYGHLFERKANERFPETRIVVNGVSIICHDFSLEEGHPKVVGSTQGVAAGKIVNPPILEEVKADMTVSLILSIMIQDDPEDMVPEISDFGHVFLDQAPMCGGTCWGQYPVETFLDIHELWGFLEQLPDGWLLQERLDLLESDTNDSLDQLLEISSVFRDDEQGPWSRNQPGWIVPLAVGYQAIEEPQKRLSVRQACPHVYAEALIGAGEFIPVKKMIFDYSATPEIPKIFWKHRHDPQAGLYYTTCE